MQNRFTNPALNYTYDWLINHETEEATGKTRNITETVNTGNVGLVKQQGDDGPLVLKWSGKILDRSQYVEMWRWYAVCKYQSILVRDFDGQEYEVQITEFSPQRVRKLSNTGRDPSIPHHYWTYTLTMEVLGFVSGDLADAGVYV